MMQLLRSILNLTFKGNKMKPFDLEAAKAGKPLITRGGSKVQFIAVAPEAHEDTRLLVLRNGRVLPLYIDGTYDIFPTDSDVFMAPEEITVWLNCYPAGVSSYSTKEKADGYAELSLRIGEARPFTYTLE
jgi:hypothetical protein